MRRRRVGHIFAYGTLMNGAEGEPGIAERAEIRAEATLIGPATIRGRMYEAGTMPGVVLGGEVSDRVHGEVWRLPHDADHLMALLDRYEGCAPGSIEPYPYRREAIRVRVGGRLRVTAWIYLWQGPICDLPLIADGRWLAAARRRQIAQDRFRQPTTDEALLGKAVRF